MVSRNIFVAGRIKRVNIGNVLNKVAKENRAEKKINKFTALKFKELENFILLTGVFRYNITEILWVPSVFIFYLTLQDFGTLAL